MISSRAAIWWERFTVFWEESLHKHPHSWSCHRSGSSSCVKHCTWAGAPSLKLAEGAGYTRLQWLPSSRPIYSLVCASKYTEAWLSCNGVVHGWGLLHPRGIFNSHNSHVWAEANPHAASVHCHKQHFVVNNWTDIVTDFLIGPYLLPWWLNAQIYHVLLEENLSEMLEEIPLSGPKTPQLHLQRSLDWTGQDNGLASWVTGPHTTLKPWFTHHQLILKKILLPYCWGSSSHQAAAWHF